MNCPTCGKYNKADANFYGDCGTSLSGYAAGGSTSQEMVSFLDAVALGFRQYSDFGGRSTRAEF